MMPRLRSVLNQAIQRLAGLPNARRDAELLLMRTLGYDRAWLLTHSEEILPAAQAAQYERWLRRRAKHEPVQYILGEQEFWGLRLRVTPDVLIPRPETEHLVEAALGLLPPDKPSRVADVGTGSGAIAIALTASHPQVQVTALDISPAALKIARENAEMHGAAGRTQFLESDLLAAVRGERFSMIVSNPPYVPSSEPLELQVRSFEPHLALFAGEDGLDIYRRLIPEAAEALEPGGWLLLEMGYGQHRALEDLLQHWSGLRFVNDLQGIPRVAIAQRR